MLQLVALPETHPLFKPVRQSTRRFIKRHRSPLHHLFHAFNMRPSDCETIAPSVCPPNEDCAVQLHVAGTCEESREEDAEDEADMRVYSDGSGIEGMAGAAAVLFWDGHEAKSIRYRLGPLTRQTTYEAEAVGVLLAVELVRRERGVRSATIRLDNQAVVQALGGRSAKPAQALLNLIHEGCGDWLDGCRRGHRQLSINWVSGLGSSATSAWTRKPEKWRAKGPAWRLNFRSQAHLAMQPRGAGWQVQGDVEAQMEGHVGEVPPEGTDG